MFRKGSRYEGARAFAPGEEGREAFPGIRPRQIERTMVVIQHMVKAGERLDLLARHYYNDDRLWWRIVDANPRFLYGGDMVRESSQPEELDSDDPAALESIDENELCLKRMIGEIIGIPRAKD